MAALANPCKGFLPLTWAIKTAVYLQLTVTLKSTVLGIGQRGNGVKVQAVEPQASRVNAVRAAANAPSSPPTEMREHSL